MKKKVSTAAYLAGVTTLAVSLPAIAAAKTVSYEGAGKASSETVLEQLLEK